MVLPQTTGIGQCDCGFAPVIPGDAVTTPSPLQGAPTKYGIALKPRTDRPERHSNVYSKRGLQCPRWARPSALRGRRRPSQHRRGPRQEPGCRPGPQSWGAGSPTCRYHQVRASIAACELGAGRGQGGHIPLVAIKHRRQNSNPSTSCAGLKCIMAIYSTCPCAWPVSARKGLVVW